MVKKMLANKKGFSLIELIVVIAILGVIAVIAVPAVMNTLRDSKIKADVQSAQGMVKATEQAWVALNSDKDTTNDLADISDKDIEAGSSDDNVKKLETKYIDMTKVPSRNPTTKFKLTGTNASTSNPTITCSFTDMDSKTHVINQSGAEQVSS